MATNDLTEVALEVRRDAPEATRVTTAPLPVRPGATVINVDEFALTANNLTYARVGDGANYWDAFPSTEPGWGRIPAWGNGTVVVSASPDLPVGTRIYGFVPMASHLVVDADRIRAGWFLDASTHRGALAPAYQAYRWWAPANPLDDPRMSALRPLLAPVFILSFVLDQALGERHGIGDRVMLTSASSKAAIGTARLLRRRNIGTIGVTSPANATRCRQLGCYDRVVTYDDIDEGVVGPEGPTVLVDFAGDPRRRAAASALLGSRLSAVVVAGFTRASGPVDLGDGTMFFAPDHIVALTRKWGRDEFERRLAASFADFAGWCSDWMTLERPNTSAEVAAAYQRVRAGTQTHERGVLASLAPTPTEQLPRMGLR